MPQYHACPAGCGKTFQTTTRVLQHLNNPLSRCRAWSKRAEAALDGPEAEDYDARFRSLFGEDDSSEHGEESSLRLPNLEPMDVDTFATDYNNSLGTGDTVPDIAMNSEQAYTGASMPQGKGLGFLQWMQTDKFANFRSKNLYYPFACKDELKFADFLMQCGMTMKDISDFMKLDIICKHLLPHLSFKTAKELRARVELLPTGPEWHAQPIVTPGFPTKKPVTLYYRDTLECVQFLLRNPLLKDHFDLIPKKLYRGGDRVHAQWINSDSAWEMQGCIPVGNTLLGVILGSDKTNISVMNGDRVAHPLYLSLANIQSDFAMKASNHAFLMTALLPIPKFLCAKDIKGVMEKRLYHHSLDIVADPLKLASASGAQLSRWDGMLLRCHTPLVSYIVDTPEAADIACVMGLTSHLTMASYHTFGDDFRHEERTGEKTWNSITEVNSSIHPSNVEAYQKASKAHPSRLSGVHLPFWRNWPLSTNPSKFLTPEVLHHIHRSFYDHDFKWGQNILGDQEIDFRLSLIQPRKGFRHFKEGITKAKQLGGRDHRDLERNFIPVMADAAPSSVVIALRALMDMRYMDQSPYLDESTLTRMEECLSLFHQHKQSIIDAGGREQPHFRIPKLEFLHSLVPSIRWAGVPMQYTADITEKAHSTEIKVPARTDTNHRDYDPQIVRHLDRAEKMRVFSLYTGLESGELKINLDYPDDGEESENDENIGSARPEAAGVPSAAGESERKIRNLFDAAATFNSKHPEVENRFFATTTTAFNLNRRPAVAKMSIAEIAKHFNIPDLRAALGDYLDSANYHHDPDKAIIGGRRRNKADCILPFADLAVWYSLRVQTKSPHKSQIMPAQTLHAQPPGVDENWIHGRYDTVILCNDRQCAWPGEGFRLGLKGHTVAQIRLLMCPIWPQGIKPRTISYLMYVQRFDIVPQPSSPTGRELSTDSFILRRAYRSDKQTRVGAVVDIDHIRTPAEVVARFGQKADPRLTPYSSLEFSREARLNKHSSKELFWILDSVSLPITTV